MFTYLPASDLNHKTIALVSSNAMLLVEARIEPQAAQQLWSTLRELNAGELLGELHALADAGFESFALLALTPTQIGDRITLAVGGNARAIINGAPPFFSPGRLATTEAHSADCKQIVLSLDEAVGAETSSAAIADSAARLPIADGIVHCSSIVYEPTPIDEPAKAPRYAAAAPTEAAETVVVEVDGAWPVPSFGAGAGAAASAEVLTEKNLREDRPATDSPAPVATAAPSTGAPTPPAAVENSSQLGAPTEAQPTNQFDHLFEHTQFFDVEAAAVRASTEHEGSAATPAAAATRPPQALSLVLPDGRSYALDRPILIGRRPTVSADANVNDYHLIKLEDRGGGLSRMHVRLDPHKGGAMVTDLGSTNGTMVATPGSRAVELRSHTPHFASEGDQLRLGNAIICFLTAQG